MRTKVFLIAYIIFFMFTLVVQADDQQMQLVSKTSGPVFDVYATTDYAYLCAGGILIILDVKDPSKPTQVGQVITPGTAWKIHISGNYAYIANGSEGGIRIIDVSNPTDPKEIGFCDTPGTAVGVYVSDNYAYIADNSDGVRVINISDPNRPEEIGFYNIPGYTSDVYVSGSYAYAISFRPGEMTSILYILDISDPKSPKEAGSYRAKSMHRVCVFGDYAYVASGSEGVRVIDVSNPKDPREVGSYKEAKLMYGIHIKGNYAYVIDNAEFLVLDISDPENLENTGNCEIPGYTAENVFASEDYAYVADQDAGLRIIDISDPVNPKEVGAFDINGSARDVHISGNYAYVVDWSKGFSIFDISNHDKPELVGHCNIIGRARSIFVSGNYAYVGNLNFDPFGGGLYVIDISVPTNPREAGFIDCQVEVESIYVIRNYAFIVDDYTNLHIVDISKPEEPKEIGFCMLVGFYGQIQITGELGRYAYISNSEGLYILDVADRKNPEVIGKYSIGAFIYETCVSGNYAYVAASEKGIRVLDISDPRNPDEITSLDIPGEARGVHISGNYAYVISGYSETITVIDISNPKNPRKILVYDAPGWWIRRVCVSDDYIYVADSNGLCILRQTGWSVQPVARQPVTWGKIKQNRLLQNYPNPFNPETWIPYELSVASEVKIRIYDSLGRLVRTLDPGLQAGEKTVRWDGKDNYGEGLSSGVYFYTIIAGKFSATRKMILLR